MKSVHEMTQLYVILRVGCTRHFRRSSILRKITLKNDEVAEIRKHVKKRRLEGIGAEAPLSPYRMRQIAQNLNMQWIEWLWTLLEQVLYKNTCKMQVLDAP